MTSTAKSGTPRRYTSTRRAKQAEQTRAEVLLAAGRLFARTGWSGTTLAAIAEEAGVAVETVYSGFRSKKALLQAAIDVAIVGDAEPVELSDRLEAQHLRGGTPQERLRGVFALVGRIYSGPVVGVWAAMTEAAASDPEIAAWAAEHERRRRRTVAEFLGMVYERALDEQVVDVVWALSSMETYRKLTVERGWTTARWAEGMADAAGRLLDPADPADPVSRPGRARK